MNEKIELFFAVFLTIIATLLLHSAFKKVAGDASIKISECKMVEKHESESAVEPY